MADLPDEMLAGRKTEKRDKVKREFPSTARLHHQTRSGTAILKNEEEKTQKKAGDLGA